MPTLKTYDLFLSHAWKYNEEYYKLVNMLREAPNFNWRNYSVPEHDPVDAGNKPRLRRALVAQIKPVNAVLILAGMYVAHREWIQFEIDTAVSGNKPIIGVKPWGQSQIPTAVSSVAKEMVGWNTSTIVSAIRLHAI